MKVTRDIKGLTFQPFDIAFTLESEEEARALYAIFSYTPNVDLLGDATACYVRRLMGGEFGDLGPSQIIANGVTYDKFYREKKEN